MLKHIRDSKFIPAMATICCAAMLGIAGTLIWQRRAPEATAKWLQERVATTIDEAEAAELVKSYRPLPDVNAIARLVTHLNDPREKVAIAARSEIRSRFHAGRLDPEADREQAEALAVAEMARVTEFRHAVIRAFVRDFAVQVMQRTSRNDPVSLLEHCSIVIRRSLPAEDSGSANVETETIPDPLAQTAVADLPGGGLTAEEPRIIEPIRTSPFPPPRDPQEPARFSPNSNAESPIEIVPSEPRALPPAVDVAPLPPLRLQAERFAELETRSLIKHLHGLPAVAAAAAEELRRRGMDESTLALARLLDHADRNRRLELIDALPGVRANDARSWLEELALDRDPEVSRRARNTLATSRSGTEWNRFQADRRR